MTVAAADATPFERLGGDDALRIVVDRFYDLMDSEPRYAELRAMHAPDLLPMRASLAGFLAGWLGGPRDWFVARPGVCMMSAHAGLGVSPATAGQWLHAMGRAIEDARLDPEVATVMRQAFARMGRTMIAAR